MTSKASEFRNQMIRMRGNFVAVHHERHDRLELLLEQVAKSGDPLPAIAEAEMILHKIAGAAGTFGMIDLGLCARQVEGLIRSKRAAGALDRDTLFNALDAFLDISLEICNPTGEMQYAS